MSQVAPLPDWLTEAAGVVRISILLVPGSERGAIVGTHDGVLRVRVPARAVEDQANRALIVLLAKTLGTAKPNVQIERGHTSRRKTVTIRDLDAQQVFARLRVERSLGTTAGGIDDGTTI